MASSSSRVTVTDMERNQDQQTEKKKKKGVRARFKKGWRAVKGCCSCTQSNDLDPSEEPYLPVLNPVVLADTADRPGCDWEQTPLEDPVDPPQDPSGLKQTAPEEPTDDTAEQQTEGKKKKKGVRARFKKGWQAMKHSCARNNKVVPLPTQSDLDPSDPQPAPEDPQPAPENPQPAPENPQPAPEDPQPPPEDPQPAPEDPQPAPEDPQPAPEDPQPAPEDPQPAPEDPQPPPVDPQPAPVDPQPAPVDPQPAPVDPQPAPVDPQPAPVDPQPAPVDPQPAPVDPQPAPVYSQPAPEDPAEDRPEGKKKKKGVRARFKKGWQAMKHSCARNNKVVPLPTHSDLDPSDPQPAPVDPQPAPVDPQPAPVYSQPAPEDPAEDRPEGKKKKKGVRARFKKGWQAMKHSCARNNKVVPLPTHSDLDPSDPQPAPVDPQPAPENPQPAPEDPQPAPEDPQPAPEDPQPAPVDPQPAPVDPQPAPEDPQPAPEDPQPAPVDPQPAPLDPLPAPLDPQPAPEDPQPAPEDPQPAPLYPQPAPVDPQPTPVDPQPAPEDPAEDRPEGKKKKGVRARFKKGWQAMKHSCARNNKVVPLPTQSDLDPSDPQPAPVDPQPAPVDPQPAPEDPQPAPVDPQPAPVDPQPAPVDPQPAPVDPQPAPVDPQPAPVDPQPAPEDPAEDRPEEKKKKKKGVRAHFKKGWQAMKHSCARNNKVVPLPTQPDLDPSDPQPAPLDPQPAPLDPQPAPVDPQPAPVDPQPAPVDPQPAPVDPQPAPADPQPAPVDPQPEDDDPWIFDFTELIEDFYRSLSDYDPYVQRLLGCFPPYSPSQFPAPWRYKQWYLRVLDKFEAFSALYEAGKNCLGKGHRGIVYQGTRKSDGLKVAIKFMSKSPNRDRFIHVPGYDKPLYSEVAVNLMLQKPERCPNIVDLLDWFEEARIYILVLEYPYPCLSLEDFLDIERLSEDQARPLMRQAVNAAQHCIDHDVCHGSLSTRNTMINIQTMTLMFIDFGRSHLASTWGKPDPEHPDDRAIPAPTWVEPSGESWGRGHAVADTVSSLGKLLLCMMGGYWLTLENDRVTKDSPELTELGLTEECLDLINRSGIASPPDRPTLEEFLDHEWFKQG